MPSSHFILCRPLLLLPPIPPSMRVFSNESTLHMRWPKYWSFSFSIIPSKDVLAGGLDKAAALGLAVGRWQMALYFAAAALTVAALQLGGSIGFVGLMM